MSFDNIEVMIPTRNRQKALEHTLSLLFAFGFPPKSIFIWDDCSEDQTYSIVKEKYPGINLFRNEVPRGVIYNRNQLWLKTTAEYVLSLDDDSCFLSIEQLLDAQNILSSNLQYGIFAFDIREQEVKPILVDIGDVHMVQTFIACGCLFKRSLIERLGNYSREELFFHGEELDCSIRTYKEGFSIVKKTGIIVHHRVDWSKRKLKKTGMYGFIWRSASGFSGHLIITALYYPYVIDLFYIIVYSIKRFYQFPIMHLDFAGYFRGLYRFITFLPYIMRNKEKMSVNLFKTWKKLPVV